MGNKYSVVLMLGILITGCSSVSTGGYYWGKYSYTYHALLKAPSDETRAAHEASLRNIIEESREKELRTPPGIAAELGYLLTLRQASEEEVMAYFEMEKTLYPESQVFLERLLSNKKSGSKTP